MKKVKLALLHENPELAALVNYSSKKDCQFFYSPHSSAKEIPSDALVLESSTDLFRKQSPDKSFQNSMTCSSEMVINTSLQSLEKNDNTKTDSICDKKTEFIVDQKVHADKNFSAVIGNSEAIRKVKRELYFVSDKECKVLFCGESGTGKSMLARILHQISLRKDYKYVSVNIGALPKELIESTLFGTVKGAFTDARDKKGLIHLAEHGTIFLDEIGEMPLSCQTKLLHTLDDGSFRKVGSEVEEKTDARFIFATNANLKELVKNKLFREDLYWRIAEFVINVPPVRTREEDSVLIAERMLQEINEKNRKHYLLTDSAKDKLMTHKWPGNIREIKSCINIATIFAQSDFIDADNIKFEQ
ncbi:sigma 54-interacting transcriptional regulator [Treponema sp.]|uniref:sigma 54-interacting transcriptional regulator n=1 Tax=Treponema sp. TaxID=166 RepID=UPI00298D813A|nr:sigma 54-interacting transcriptional regulator [Treponema sp.]